MAIIQISKIQQRSGNLVDLPQLDEAEFGWASDAKRLFIGKTTPNENIEVLTSYSTISFSQIDGVVGNISINPVSIANGQLLTFNGTNWTNRGGNAGGLITLGDAANVKITGGSSGYTLQTDGTGNLTWAPSGVIVAFIQNVTKANPAVVTTVSDNFFVDGAKITITNAQGMIDLNGQTYYANVLTSNTFSLYTDSALTTTVNSSAYNAYSYTNVTGTTVTTNRVTVGNSAQFTANSAVQFIGSMSTSGLVANTTYYVYDKPTATTLRVATSGDGNISNVVALQTTSGLTANVYQTGGRAVGAFGSGTSFGVAGGTNTTVQFNNAGLLDGSSDLTYNFSATPKILTLNGNANVGNLNATGTVTTTRLISNIATGTTPIQVVSTTRVPNLNVSYANVSDFGAVTTQTTGTFYPVFVSGNTTANYALASNANISFNAATGLLTTSTLSVVGNANVGNLGTAGLIVATGNVTGGNLNTAGVLSVTGNANVGNLGTNTAIITTGNVTTINSGLMQNSTSNIAIASGANVTLSVAGTARITATSTGANVNGTLGVTGTTVIGNATANLTIGSGSNGVMTLTGNANVGNIGAVAGVFTGNVTVANVFANSGQARAGNVTSLGYFYRSVTTGVAATGTSQATAAVFTTEIVEFSTVPSGSGALLPVASPGMIITIVNTGGNALSVYPNTGDTINSLAVNIAYTQPVGATLQYVALDASRWYTVGATFA